MGLSDGTIFKLPRKRSLNQVNFFKTDLQKFFLGLVLLVLPIFFNDNFNGGWISIGVYVLLVVSGVSTVLYFLANLLKVNCLYLFSIVLIIEAGVYFTFTLVKQHCVKSPSIVQFSKDMYFQYSRNIPSFQMGLGKYDPDLFYTLQPGNSVNSNLEYSNHYQVNSQGIRDDETSLYFPEIIMLGDSHTMGWGVEQEETFANLLEKRMATKILNTGIVSYGTSREYLMFQKLKTDSCQTIVWQYCSNDMRENKSFLENGNELKISSEREYQFRYKRNFLQSNYYPFKYSFETFAHQIRKVRKQRKEDVPSLGLSDQVDNFFRIIKLMQEGFKGEIIIFNLESFDTTDQYYLAFKKYVEENHLEKIQLIDFSTILKKEDYFIIDGHINVSGHQKVSEAIFRKIQNESKSMSQNGI
ncbi:MAG: hypothetical protein AB8F94_16555 [Saprospiraceae bacterium]